MHYHCYCGPIEFSSYRLARDVEVNVSSLSGLYYMDPVGLWFIMEVICILSLQYLVLTVSS